MKSGTTTLEPTAESVGASWESEPVSREFELDVNTVDFDPPSEDDFKSLAADIGTKLGKKTSISR